MSTQRKTIDHLIPFGNCFFPFILFFYSLPATIFIFLSSKVFFISSFPFWAAASVGDKVRQNGQKFHFVGLFVHLSICPPPLWAIQPGLRHSQPNIHSMLQNITPLVPLPCSQSIQPQCKVTAISFFPLPFFPPSFIPFHLISILPLIFSCKPYASFPPSIKPYFFTFLSPLPSPPSFPVLFCFLHGLAFNQKHKQLSIDMPTDSAPLFPLTKSRLGKAGLVLVLQLGRNGPFPQFDMHTSRHKPERK